MAKATLTLRGTPDQIAAILALWGVMTAKNTDDCMDTQAVALDQIELIGSFLASQYVDRETGEYNFGGSSLSERRQRAVRTLIELSRSA